MSCGRCRRRLYCSRECQLDDWKEGHKYWCGHAGEINFDFELGECEGNRGIGMFALRVFEPGEKIFVERVINRSSLRSQKGPTARAVLELMPRDIDNEFDCKFKLNSITLEDEEHYEAEAVPVGEPLEPHHIDETKLCVTIARINHHCMGNVSYKYIKKHKVVIIVAARRIEPQEEICMAYVDLMNNPGWHVLFDQKWQFECTCEYCSDSWMKEKIIDVYDLSNEITVLGTNHLALVKGHQRLALYKEINAPIIRFMHAYLSLFSIAIAHEGMLADAKKFIAEAMRYGQMLFADFDVEEMPQIKAYFIDPTSHPNYLCAKDF